MFPHQPPKRVLEHPPVAVLHMQVVLLLLHHFRASTTPATAPVMTKESKIATSPQSATTSNTASSLPKNYNGKNVLHHVKTSEEEIVLDFGSAVAESSVKIFVLKTTDGYKKIIDIPAIIMNAPLKISTPKKLQSLRISQYNANNYSYYFRCAKRI